MSSRIQSVRGMHDILPGRARAWEYLEAAIRRVVKGYGYREIRLPVVEFTELFARSIGEVTDIVEKEMYTFKDRNGDSLTLRPEGTASCVRAGVEHGLLHNQQQRLWYTGPMFRHERPQKGRYRQFYQAGVEAFGMEGPDIDAELILMSARLWRELGITGLRLEINTLGDSGARAAYRKRLIDYLHAHEDRLDEDAKRRLHTNPLRVLDNKNPDMRSLIRNAPSLLSDLDAGSAAHFKELRALLEAAGVEYTLNPRLMRGLDYYTRTVFEWICDALGAQSAVCAGGRYDGLVGQLGGRPTPAAGFAIGLERVLDLMEQQNGAVEARAPDVFVATIGQAAGRAGHALAERLRDALDGVTLIVNCGGGNLKAQLRRADRAGARLALILGEDEIASDSVTIKHLRQEAEQRTVALSEVARTLEADLGLRARPGGHEFDEYAEKNISEGGIGFLSQR